MTVAVLLFSIVTLLALPALVIPYLRAKFPENRSFVTALVLLWCAMLLALTWFENILHAPRLAVEAAIAVFLLLGTHYVFKAWPPVQRR